MSRYIFHRLLAGLATLLAVLAAVFVLINLAPGDPVDAFVPPGQSLGDTQKAVLRHELGLDRSLPVRFGAWLTRTASGDLGVRFKDGSPVADEIAHRIGPTALLACTSLAIAVPAGIALGLVAARCRGRVADHALSLLACVAISSPPFLVGIVALSLFSLTLGWFPSGGYGTPGIDGPGDSLRHLLLPAAVLSLQYTAILMRYTRGSLLDTLGQDYIRTAHAKGLAPNRVLLRHALPNALLPIVTVIGASAGTLAGGAVFVETVFSWPGMGLLFVDAIENRDYPLIMGIALFVSLAVLVLNLLTDLAYSWMDPRIALK